MKKTTRRICHVLFVLMVPRAMLYALRAVGLFSRIFRCIRFPVYIPLVKVISAVCQTFFHSEKKRSSSCSGRHISYFRIGCISSSKFHTCI